MESKVNFRIDVTGFGCNRWAIFISTSDTGSSDSGSRAMYNAAHLTLLKSTHLHLKNFWCLDVVFLNVYSGQNMFYLTYCNFFLLLSRAKAKDFLKYSCVFSFFLWLCEIPVYIHFFDLTTRGSLLEEPQHDEWWFKSLFLLIYQIPFLWSTILKWKQQISVY